MRVRTVQLTGAAIAALLGVAAQAQVATPPAATAEETGALEDIVVTGSRIRRDPLSQSAPVQVLDSASLAQTGLSSVADILQRIPAASGGLNSRFNNSGNLGNPPDGGGVGAGSAEVELRYLGSRRTLVLVDGMRFVNGSSASGIPASVDLNSLPAGMVDRIEVLQSAASALYGSDAIAGVVNIITKSEQAGLQASAQYGQFRQGDGATQDYNISYGIKGEATSVVVGVSYVKADLVSTADRPLSQLPNPGATSCLQGGCSGATPLGQFFLSPSQVLTLKAPVAGRPRFDATNPTGPNSDFKPFTTGDRFNFAPFNFFITPSERYGGLVSIKQALSDRVNFRVKALYNRRNSQNQAAFLPLFLGPDAGSGTVTDTFSIDATSPFNPFGVTLSAGGPGEPPANYGFIARRVVEAGPRSFSQKVDTMSVTGTLDGAFDVGARTWYWDVNAVLGYNYARQVFTGNINTSLLRQALGPISQCTGACVPFNIFGGVGSITPAMLGFVGFTEQSRSQQKLNDYTANLNGTLFDMPAGPVGFAVGYEHRNQSGSFTPDPIVEAGFSADIPARGSSGAFKVDEVYGELRVPLLSDIPLINSLEVDGAIRYSKYSTFGDNTTYTGNVLWKPFSDLLVRGSYATALRAPSIGELFGAPSRFDGGAFDPCNDINGTLPGNVPASATVRANCIANGVPANGSYAVDAAGASVVTGGNITLQPETSRTIAFGGAYSPAWARNSGFARTLVLEGSYSDVKLDGAIASVPADLTLARCAQTGDPLSCGNIQRTPAGFVGVVNGILQNIGGIRVKAIDVNFTYRSPETSVGSFGLTWNNTWLLRYEESVPSTGGFTVIDRTGTTRGSPVQSYPRYKANAILDWAIAGFTASFTGRYISGVTESANARRLNRILYGDVQLGYTPSFLDDRMTFTVGVNNVFNSGPPPCFSCTGPSFHPTTYDSPVQFGYLRVALRL
ncbi:TonB-dependent receptor [Polymorphobacter multimanifer]|uniref:TonB-dependent receptor plug domain-containing protein n=1 Tax=Polymorphobacter multimanifer TaxID=1070431 RepID=UPI00166E3363|nr:TonB-dependent receptor [Polymorphobacter multimanifer]GGI73195.1 TonB-dependent receptor [Polymorphobacter multimanifer]